MSITKKVIGVVLSVASAAVCAYAGYRVGYKKAEAMFKEQLNELHNFYGIHEKNAEFIKNCANKDTYSTDEAIGISETDNVMRGAYKYGGLTVPVTEVFDVPKGTCVIKDSSEREDQPKEDRPLLSKPFAIDESLLDAYKVNHPDFDEVFADWYNDPFPFAEPKFESPILVEYGEINESYEGCVGVIKLDDFKNKAPIYRINEPLGIIYEIALHEEPYDPSV